MRYDTPQLPQRSYPANDELRWRRIPRPSPADGVGSGRDRKNAS